jgi:hypothetical protein
VDRRAGKGTAPGGQKGRSLKRDYEEHKGDESRHKKRKDTREHKEYWDEDERKRKRSRTGTARESPNHKAGIIKPNSETPPRQKSDKHRKPVTGKGSELQAL